MNPLPQQMLHKHLPPKILPLRYKINLDARKIPLDASVGTGADDYYEKNREFILKSPKLPIISIKGANSKAPNRKRVVYYSKNLPKFPIYKPLFHGRNRSYNRVPEEDDEYISMKNQISFLDY